MASVAQISGYTFADNEVNLVTVSRQTRYSPRNKKLSSVVTMRCEGELIYSSTASIISKITEVENALKDDNKEFRYTVGGTLAHSLLNTADCISGVKVIQRSFPKGDPSQLTTTRSFSFTLQGTYDAPETDLVSWTETIETIGTGGPKFFLVETVFQPVGVYVTTASAQYFHQTGSAVGYTNYPAAGGPANLGTEYLDRRRITKISGRNQGQAIRFYTTRWSYQFANDPTGFGGKDGTPVSQ